MSNFEVVAIGASAGGIEALQELLPMFPKDLPVSIFVDQHTSGGHENVLKKILEPICNLDVRSPENEEALAPSTIYVCPPGRHLLVSDKKCWLLPVALPHFPKPSIDLLFESIAGEYKNLAIGVILTGLDSDGALGVRAIHERGGVTIAQDEATAAYPSMPCAAIKTGEVDYILKLPDIAPAIVNLVKVGFKRSIPLGRS